jgi:hypothetical protein
MALIKKALGAPAAPSLWSLDTRLRRYGTGSFLDGAFNGSHKRRWIAKLALRQPTAQHGKKVKIYCKCIKNMYLQGDGSVSRNLLE